MTDILGAVQYRVARPTDRLQEVVSFYHDGLGLPIVSSFEDHDGYDGVMIGLPDVRYHLEFTRHAEGSPCPAPSKDNLLVFYIPDRTAIQSIASRLAAMGFPEVEPENPYWRGKSVTVEDPDGWRIVLMNTSGLSAD
ncbi:VOC family protein [Paenibacillus thermotolerans]|uniref:VOC family protein n=1 Tax=Paenibacillus thermotolerans TaxID=3027807 RepID=UPI002368002E|nr:MULTISPECIES: VOC family protein [unclassified Paenibacillus]